MQSLLVLLLVLTLGVTAPVGAQEITFVEFGTPVRITSRVFTGVGRVAWASDTVLALVVEQRVAPVAVPLGSISALSVRHQNSRWEGARRWIPWGVLLGGAAWGLSHAFVDYGETDPDAPGYTRLTRAGALLLYTGVGGALGGGWGALRPGVRWQRTPNPVRVLVAR